MPPRRTSISRGLRYRHSAVPVGSFTVETAYQVPFPSPPPPPPAASRPAPSTETQPKETDPKALHIARVGDALVKLADRQSLQLAVAIKNSEEAIRSHTKEIDRAKATALRSTPERIRKRLEAVIGNGWDVSVSGNTVALSRSGDFSDKLARPIVVFRGKISFSLSDRGGFTGPFFDGRPVDPATNAPIKSRFVAGHWYVSSNGVCMGNFRDRFAHAASAGDFALAAALAYQVITTAPDERSGPYHHHSEFASIVRCDGDRDGKPCGTYYTSLSLSICPECGSTKRTGTFMKQLSVKEERSTPEQRAAIRTGRPPTPSAPTPDPTPTGAAAEIFTQLGPRFRAGHIEIQLVHVTDEGHACSGGCGTVSPGNFQMSRDGRLICTGCTIYFCEGVRCRRMFSFGSTAHPNPVYTHFGQSLRVRLFGSNYICPRCVRRMLENPTQACAECSRRFDSLRGTLYNTQGSFCNEECLGRWAASEARHAAVRISNLPALDSPGFAAFDFTLSEAERTRR